MNPASALNGHVFKASIVLFILSSIIMGLVKNLRQLFSRNKIQAIIYALFIIVTFALIGLLSSHKVLNDTISNSFLGMQILFLILGSLHLYVLKRFFPDLESDNKDSGIFTQFLFSLVIVFIGFIGYINVINQFRPSFVYLFLSSGIFFIIPFLTYKLFLYATNIPVRVYKTWFYPIGENIKDPSKQELTNPSVIAFEFQKKNNDNELTNFRIKAPENMEFGKLFYFFIEDYNERHPDGTIEFLNEKSQAPYGWNFYFKPNWVGNTQHIDFSKSVLSNNIKENDIIVCRRA